MYKHFHGGDVAGRQIIIWKRIRLNIEKFNSEHLASFDTKHKPRYFFENLRKVVLNEGE